MGLTKVVNVKKEAEYDVYIGRQKNHRAQIWTQPGQIMVDFGNPFPVPQHGRDRCIELFKEYFYRKIETDSDFRAAVLQLKGKTLGCFCKPLVCHGDVIANYLNSLED